FSLDLDAVDDGGMEGKDPLDADPAGDLADGESLARPAAAPGDHDAGEDLDAFLLSLADLHVHADGVPRSEIRQIGFQRRLLDFQQDVGHGVLLQILDPAATPDLRAAAKRAETADYSRGPADPQTRRAIGSGS